MCRSPYRHLTEDEVNSPEERKKRESHDQVIYSRLRSSASTQDFEEDYSTPEYELYEDDDGDGISHATECDDESTPMTHTLVLRQFGQKEMTWFLELSCQESRIWGTAHWYS